MIMFKKLFFISVPVFFILDMLWLGLVAKSFYAKEIGFMMKSEVNWTAAIIFYLIFLAGLTVFVIVPAVEKNNWKDAMLYGAFFGLVTYATFDLTNLATIKNWPLTVTIVDLIWGMVLSASVSVATFFIASKIN
jgi:uncharacterized membrane protein